MHLIVGIDPGIKTAFAAIDLNGRPVSSKTLKGANADMVVREIAKTGIPSMIASDVNPAPAFVQKIAARFNVRTFVPSRNMQEKEKMEIAGETANLPTSLNDRAGMRGSGAEVQMRTFGTRSMTLHERDALAAAIKCYRFYANRLRQIELSAETKKDKLKHLVIQGFSLKIATGMMEKELY